MRHHPLVHDPFVLASVVHCGVTLLLVCFRSSDDVLSSLPAVTILLSCLKPSHCVTVGQKGHLFTTLQRVSHKITEFERAPISFAYVGPRLRNDLFYVERDVKLYLLTYFRIVIIMSFLSKFYERNLKRIVGNEYYLLQVTGGLVVARILLQ